MGIIIFNYKWCQWYMYVVKSKNVGFFFFRFYIFSVNVHKCTMIFAYALILYGLKTEMSRLAFRDGSVTLSNTV